MSVATECMNVYKAAKARATAGTATMQDEVLIALWELTQQQARELRQAYDKISMLETIGTDVDSMFQCDEALDLFAKLRYTSKH